MPKTVSSELRELISSMITSPNVDAEDARGRLLQTCEAFLCEKRGSATPSEAEHLAVAKLKAAKSQGRKITEASLNADFGGFPSGYGTFAVWRAFAQSMSLEFGDLLADSGQLGTLRQLSKRFMNAIKPTPVGSLVTRKWFASRVEAFLGFLDLPEDAVRGRVIAAATQVFRAAGKPGLSPEDVLEVHSLERFRTYDDETLTRVCENFAEWNALVRFVTDPDSKATIPDDLRRELTETLRRVTERALKRVTRTKDKGRKHDAVGAVLDRLGKYNYESDLVAWLVSSANREALRDEKEQKRKTPLGVDQMGESLSAELPVGSEDPVADPGASFAQELAESLVEWRLRFQLINFTYSKKSLPGVAVVLRCLLLTLQNESFGDDFIADELKKADHRMTPQAIATMKHWLRRRVQILQKILDDPGPRTSPTFSDEELGIVVYKPTSNQRGLRKVAALSRVARADNSVRAATLSALLELVRKKETLDFLWPPLQSDELDAAQRLDRLFHGREKALLKGVRVAELSFLSAPLALLHGVRNEEANAILQLLQVEGDEAHRLKQVLSNGNGARA